MGLKQVLNTDLLGVKMKDDPGRDSKPAFDRETASTDDPCLARTNKH